MKMEDWAGFTARFLELSDYPILTHKGKVTALEAKVKAAQEFETFRETQDRNHFSDCDKEVKRLKGDNGLNC